MREALEETRFRGRECESMFGHFDEPEFFERGENALRGVTSRSKYLAWNRTRGTKRVIILGVHKAYFLLFVGSI